MLTEYPLYDILDTSLLLGHFFKGLHCVSTKDIVKPVPSRTTFREQDTACSSFTRYPLTLKCILQRFDCRNNFIFIASHLLINICKEYLPDVILQIVKIVRS